MDEAYSMSPVRASPRQLLESPPRQPPAVCKTPYRVLDAPDLADDFHLNLVDWSTTNILGVGPGAHVYLWTAYNAAVAKLCDLSNVGDTMSSVAWVQKVLVTAAPFMSSISYISYFGRAPSPQWAPSLEDYTFTMLLSIPHTILQSSPLPVHWYPIVECRCTQFNVT
ncbi:hypothetical protein EDD17DRAFT_1765451 [Pisolithus thermaeus]|nr:hypothetical protein EDD17DRAFT_1765451 [Pisolithus thermaeus]